MTTILFTHTPKGDIRESDVEGSLPFTGFVSHFDNPKDRHLVPPPKSRAAYTKRRGYEIR